MRTNEIIKKLMEFYTTKELSQVTGYSENAISSWRTGKHEPPFYAVMCLAEATGYEIKFVRKQDD